MLNRLQKLTRKMWQNLPLIVRVGVIRRTQEKFTASATAIIVNDKGEVLLLDHVFRPTSGWALPGGFLQASEQVQAAVQREIREEVGLELINVTLYFAHTNGRHIEIYLTASPVGEPRVNSREIIGFKWFRLDEVPSDMSYTQQRLIREVLQTGFD
jgi:ADP-ribose pyrophosphatase YjhB (NUDIX family)